MNNKVKVLIVEDEKIISKDIKLILESNGYEVIANVDCYEDAVEKAETDSPDIVIMDIILKGYYNGIDAANKITEKFGIPIIYLTGLSDDESFFNAMLSKPFAYIVKPLKEEELLKSIKNILFEKKL